MNRLFAVAVACCLLLVGCDAAGPTEFERQVVVESFQTSGEALAPVRLTQTTELDTTFDADRLAVRGADVRVELLSEEGGSVVETYPYAPVPDSNGFYQPVEALNNEPVPRVRPLHTYRLIAEVPDGPVVRASTTTPDTFRVVRTNRDTTVYQGPQVELTVTPSRTLERDQTFYIFSTEALEPTEENLTPLAREFILDDDETSVNDVRITSSPIINEAGYEFNEDGTITIDLPWIAVIFYGPTVATASAIDDNLYDFIRSQSVQQGGGGFNPGTIPRLIEHVENGTGVFGSRAVASRKILIQRR